MKIGLINRKMSITKAIILLICSIVSVEVMGQNDTTTILDNINIAPRNTLLHNIFQDAVNSIKRAPGDTLNENNILIIRSEKAFEPYEGKYIRKIIVRRFGFERTFSDTTNRITFIGTQILNALHSDTREWVIRDNLFIHAGSQLNAYELADNERYLRTLDFIQDARIFVNPVKGHSDSVDVLVFTKDLFTITGVLDIGGINSVKLRLAEANLFGQGQRIQGTGLWDQNRTPSLGYEFLYSKTNISGSFVNGTVGYSVINGGRSDGTEEEAAFFVRFDRPLVSPFSHIAGGIEFSTNRSMNVYQKPDSLYFSYQYNVYDAWVGYNLGTKRLEDYRNYNQNRNRVFVSARYLQADFLSNPYQIGDNYDPVYNNKKAILGQLTFFKQDFFKLNYLYGFGTTEDIPMGYTLSLTAGWYKQLDLERPYAGIQAEQYFVTDYGGFVNPFVKLGGFYHQRKLQDASVLAGVNFFSRLFFVKRWKVREFMKISYTQLDNRVIYEPLRLNNIYGLHQFSTDSVYGNKRISLYTESILYTNRKLWGFRFAPFISGDFSLVAYEREPFKKSDVFTGLGGGIRTRNDNLVFGTIELRAIYFPRTVRDVDQFRLVFSSDIRFRYKSVFVKAPDIVHLNRDDI